MKEECHLNCIIRIQIKKIRVFFHVPSRPKPVRCIQIKCSWRVAVQLICILNPFFFSFFSIYSVIYRFARNGICACNGRCSSCLICSTCLSRWSTLNMWLFAQFTTTSIAQWLDLGRLWWRFGIWLQVSLINLKFISIWNLSSAKLMRTVQRFEYKNWMNKCKFKKWYKRIP